MGSRHTARAFTKIVTHAAPFAAAAMIAASASAYAADYTPQEQALIEAAKKEGSVVVLNPQFSDWTGRHLGEGFVKKYNLGPDFKFNNLRKGTGATVAQTRQEIQAGKHSVDILIVSAPGFFAEAAKRGAFEKLDSGYWKQNHEAGANAAGQYSNYPFVVVPFAYTFQPVWNSSCPGMENFSASSYADVLKPELKGKTIASDITKSFTYTNTALALEEQGVKLADLWKKLKATDPLVEFRTEPKMQMVVSCQRPLDMWNLSGRAYQSILKKPELKKVLKFGTYKEGQVMLGNQAAVIKGAPHPNAAKLFIEYLLSKEGTDIFVAGEMMYSFMKDYTPPDDVKHYLFDTKTTKMIGLKDWIETQDKFKKVRSDWQAVFQ
ncbi:MAG: ABC transporter substrate-binding protein [Pseudolabrys sp.]|nr:ABC transporter substrate-binding protein [Pseudolabrys sp.]